MKKKNRSKKIIGGIVLFIFGLLGGFCGGFFFGKLLKSQGGSFKLSYILIILLSIYVWVFISINIHELGHLVFGKKAKYKLVGYSILCFNWITENEKMKFYIKFNKNIGGLCAMIPSEECSKKDHLLFISGGVIFNFISVILMFITLVFLPSGYYLIKGILIMGMIMTLVLAVINFVPMKSLGAATDGNIFWRMLRNEHSGQNMLKFMNIANNLRRGIRFRDLDLDFEIMDNKEFDVFELQIVLFKYFQALDLNDEEGIREYIRVIENNLGNIPDHVIIGVHNELIYFYSAIELNEDKSRKYFEKAKKMLIKDKDINGRRILAAYKYYIEKNVEEAEKCALDGLAVKDKYALKGQAFLEEELIRKILENIKLEII